MIDLPALLQSLRPYASIIAIASSIVGLATLLIGLLAKHVADRRQRAYEARLAFVRDQLKLLYGPLFLLTESNDRAWREFRQRFRPGRELYDPRNPLTPDERKEYVRWLEVVFVPCNQKIRTIVESNAHLFLEGRAPSVVLDLLAHYDALNFVLLNVKLGLDDNVFPDVLYPEAFTTYVRNDYEKVVERHSRLTEGKNVD